MPARYATRWVRWTRTGLRQLDRAFLPSAPEHQSDASQSEAEKRARGGLRDRARYRTPVHIAIVGPTTRVANPTPIGCGVDSSRRRVAAERTG